MNTKESEKDKYATFITGLTYSIVLGIILLACCIIINESWFDYSATSIIIAIICIGFFLSGLKKVDEKNIGFLTKLGRRDFEETYSEGLWWIFPLWTFKQKPHFDLLNEAEELQFKFITSDDIPLDITVKYYWQSKDLKNIDNRYSATYIKDKLQHELGIVVRSHQAIELLSDEDISNKVMANYLVSAGERIGISISDVFPNINYESQYIPVVRNFQEKYKKLHFQLDEMLTVKSLDMQLFANHIHACVKNLGLSPNEALNFIKVYKNQINMNENTYNINIGEINKIIDSVISAFRR